MASVAIDMLNRVKGREEAAAVLRSVKGPGGARAGFSVRGARRRDEQRARLARRVTRPVSPESGVRDPLSRAAGGRGRGVWAVGGFVVLAVVVHAAIVAALGALSSGEQRGLDLSTPEKVVVRMVQPELPAPVEPEPAPEPAPVEVAPEPAPEPAPAERPRPKSRNKKAVPPPDPVDVPDQAPPPSAERRRIVGLSLESTVSGADGPSFAVGNTRMGTTGDRAEDAKSVQKLGPSTGEKRAPQAASGPNQVASRIPVRGVEFEKPRRLAAVQPQYPGLLKAQGIEGNVGVLVRIDDGGAVVAVKVVKSSGYAELDRAAVEAAKKERFSPAKRDGQPVEYSLKYTYRFRIVDA